MNIVICDDDAGFLEDAKNTIEKQCESVKVCTCTGIKELRMLCSRISFDLAFIDIVLDEEKGAGDGGSGIDAAVEVLKYAPDMRVVFMSAHTGIYAEHAYNYPGYAGFIPKPVSPERIKAYIDRREKELARDSGVLMLRRGKQDITIPLDSIIYIESDKRRLGFVLEAELRDSLAGENDDGKKIYFYTKLRSLDNSLSDRFIRTHQSFIINIAHSGTLGRTDIFMDNGDAVPISRAYINSVRRAYFKYKGGDIL